MPIRKRCWSRAMRERDDVCVLRARRSARSRRRARRRSSARPRRSARGALTGFSLMVVADAGALSEHRRRSASRTTLRPAARCSRRWARAPRSSPDRCSTAGASASRSSAPLQVGEIATTHPVLRDAGDWHRVRFFRHRAVQVGDDDKVLIALRGRLAAADRAHDRRRTHAGADGAGGARVERPGDSSAVRAVHRRGRALPGARRRLRRQRDRRLGRFDRIDRGRRRADIRSAGRARARPGADARRRIA